MTKTSTTDTRDMTAIERAEAILADVPTFRARTSSTSHAFRETVARRGVIWHVGYCGASTSTLAPTSGQEAVSCGRCLGAALKNDG